MDAIVGDNRGGPDGSSVTSNKFIMSRLHFIIRCEMTSNPRTKDGKPKNKMRCMKFWIRDPASTYRTHLNNELLDHNKEYELKIGSNIRVVGPPGAHGGSIEYEFRFVTEQTAVEELTKQFGTCDKPRNADVIRPGRFKDGEVKRSEWVEHLMDPSKPLSKKQRIEKLDDKVAGAAGPVSGMDDEVEEVRLIERKSPYCTTNSVIKVGDSVEVLDKSPGFRGAWFPCTVVDMDAKGETCIVRYEHTDQDGTPMKDRRIKIIITGKKVIPGYNKTVTQQRFSIRPARPQELVEQLPAPKNGWRIGTIIDCLHEGCYFSGEVMSLPEKNDPEQIILIQFEPLPEGEGTQEKHSLSKTQRGLDFVLVGKQPNFGKGESGHCGRWEVQMMQ